MQNFYFTVHIHDTKRVKDDVTQYMYNLLADCLVSLKRKSEDSGSSASAIP